MKYHVLRFAVLVEVILIGILIIVPVANLYQNNSIHDDDYAGGYVSFDDVVDYDSIFFNPDMLSDQLYTLGFTSQRNARENQGKESWTKLKTYSESSIIEFNEILKKCHFKSVDRLKASVLSVFISGLTNVAFTQIGGSYIMPELLEEPDLGKYFNVDVLNNITKKKFGISDASINYILGKTYLFALFYTDTEVITIESGEKYTVPSGDNMMWGVFEIIDNSGEQNLLLNRNEYNFYNPHGKNRTINYFNPISRVPVYSILVLIILTLSAGVAFKVVDKRRRTP